MFIKNTVGLCVIALCFTANAAVTPHSNFTMLNPTGQVFGGTNDVVFDWGGSEYSSQTSDLTPNMTIASAGPTPFFGAPWTAHHVRVFGPGTYSFDSGCTTTELEATGCPAGSAANSGTPLSMTVGAGQVGAHILFDYNGSINIDIIVVWDKDGIWSYENTFWQGFAITDPSGDPPFSGTTWELVSTDVNGDGIPGAPMIDGPFTGFYANFNSGPESTLSPDIDGDGIPNDTDTDDDNDGVLDIADINPNSPFQCEDVDSDTCDDCFVGADQFGPLPDNFPLNDGLDSDADGACNFGDTDDDDDTVLDVIDNCPLTPNTDQSDVDDDGIGDVCETDTDQDGLSDEEEDINRNGVVDFGETDPLDFDSDDDGLTDGYEVNTSSTDPLSPTTLPEPGDMNNDSVLNAGDLILLEREILGD